MALLAVAALVTAANAFGNYSTSTYAITKTDVVNSYVTYCPGPTDVVVNNKTYHVTSASTLTITDCPCTVPTVVTTTGCPYMSTEEETHPAYTTYCPTPAIFTENSKIYTATQGETVTVSSYAVTTSQAVTPGVPYTKTAYVTQKTSVPSYETYVPSSTVFTVAGPTSTATYSVSSAQVVTVTNGPFSTVKVMPTPNVITPGPAPGQTVPAEAPKVKAPKPSPPVQPFVGSGARVLAGLGAVFSVGVALFFQYY